MPVDESQLTELAVDAQPQYAVSKGDLSDEVPREMRHRAPWQHALDVLDEIIEDWHLPRAPVLADCRNETEVEPLLSGLESRGLGYVVEVGPGVAVRGMARRPGGGPALRVTAAQCVQIAARRFDRTTLTWPDTADGGLRQAQFLAVPLPAPLLPHQRPDDRERSPASRPRLIVAEWRSAARWRVATGSPTSASATASPPASSPSPSCARAQGVRSTGCTATWVSAISRDVPSAAGITT